MKHMNNQKGGLDLILVILVVALALAAVSTYVIQQRNSKYDVNPNPVAAIFKKKAAAPPPASDEFVVKELGIKFNLTADITDLSYVIQTHSGVTSAYFSTTTLLKSDQFCTASEGPIGAIDVLDKPDDSEGSPPSLIKQLGSKYLYYSHPQATCSDVKSVQDLQTAQISALVKALSSAELSQ
ncbi:MAG TPA: hypothetical protein VLF41_03800 [Candidatus Nanoarchaeia archaeon]|nr:hypothetical protein [Candidatus Nanoarchaeia archaeon]